MRARAWLLLGAGTAVLAACAVLGDLPNPAVVDNLADGGVDAADAAPDVAPPSDAGTEAAADADGDAGFVPTQLVTGIRPWNLAVDDTYVYWSAPFNYQVGRADKKDGANVVLLASGTGSAGFAAWGVALDANYVYWVNTSAVLRCAKTGCANAPTKLTDTNASARYIAVDDTYAYYTESSTMTLNRVLKAGGTPTAFATFTEQPEHVVLDSGYLYVTLDTSVARVAVANGAVQTLVKSPQVASPSYLTIALDKVYFTEFGDPGPVDFVATTGADAGFGAFALNQSIPFGITNDAQNVYWVATGNPSAANGKIMRCAKASCSPTPVATGQNDPKMIVNDGTALYWTNEGNNSTTYDDGAVMRLQLK